MGIRMRRFKIGSANQFFLLAGIALGSQLGLGGSQAMAAIYDFSFDSTLGSGSIEWPWNAEACPLT